MHGLTVPAPNLLRLGFNVFVLLLTKQVCKGFACLFKIITVLHITAVLAIVTVAIVTQPSQDMVYKTPEGALAHRDAETNKLLASWIANNQLSAAEELNLWRLTEQVGVRKVRSMSNADAFTNFGAAFSRNRVAMFAPWSGTIHLSDTTSLEQFLDEVPHVDQFQNDRIGSYLRGSWLIYETSMRSLVSSRSFRELYNEYYRDSRNLEGEAHGPRKAELLDENRLSNVNERIKNQQ